MTHYTSGPNGDLGLQALAIVGMVALPFDALFNVASLGEKAVIEGTVKIAVNIVRNKTVKKEFLNSIIDKSPKYMKQWLSEGKVPPGYNVHHNIPLYKGGTDTIDNMRLIDIDMHKTITRIWRNQ